MKIVNYNGSWFRGIPNEKLCTKVQTKRHQIQEVIGLLAYRRNCNCLNNEHRPYIYAMNDNRKSKSFIFGRPILFHTHAHTSSSGPRTVSVSRKRWQIFTDNLYERRGADVAVSIDMNVVSHARVVCRLNYSDRQRRLRVDHLSPLIHHLSSTMSQIIMCIIFYYNILLPKTM